MKFIITKYYINFIVKITFVHLLLSVVLITGYSEPVLGQESLKRTVYIDARESSVKDILATIAKQAHLKFSYSTRTIDARKKIDFQSLGTVESMLQQLFGNQVMVMKLAGQLLLLKSPPAISEEKVLIRAAITVSGVVTDESGQPVPGVNVVEKGTANGTVTDVDGKFSLNVETTSSVIVFSAIGYLSEEITIGAQNTINVTLKTDTKQLDEVVVVGYGTQEKKDLTGAVSSISNETLVNRQSVQVSDALQGTMAGVTVTRSSGQPGGESTVRIRGVTSLNVNDPLVIVDGVPGLSINDINPNDIETITVLKDAASQAIYGARAAAGVILITTMRGKEGKLQLSYDYEYGSNSPTALPSFVNAKSYRNLINERSTNDGGGNIYDPAVNQNYDELHRTNPDQYPDTNWQDATLKKETTRRYRHDLSMSVGTEKIKTRASISYVAEDGLYANKNFERYTFRVNNNLKMYKWFEANVDVYFKRSKSLDPSLDDVVRLARLYPGIYSATRTDGLWGEGKDGENNLATTEEGGTLEQHFNQLNGVLGVTFKPMEGLSIRANISPTYSFNQYDKFTTPPLIPRQRSTTEFWPQGTTKLDKRNASILNLTRQVMINYAKKINNHRIEALAGYEEIGTDWEEIRTASNGLSVNLPSLTFGDPSLTTNNQYSSENALRSYFGRLSYDYKEKYLIQSNFRADGSSRFSPEKRWGFFPSFSLGWVVSNENFKLPGIFSFLKLRTSYGEVGNERIGEDRTNGSEFFNFYPYQNLYERTTAIFYNGNFVPKTGIRQNFLPDKSIVWETTRTIDIGLDIALFNDRFTLAADYYQKNTSDIILTLDLPNYLGYPDDTKTNVGSMKVNGLDLEAGYRGSVGRFSYVINANASHVSSEVTDVGGRADFTTEGGTKINIKGREFNEWYGYQTRGIYQTLDESKAYGVNALPGDIRIVDQLTIDSDHDGVPDTRDFIINERDRVPLGPSLQKFSYGGNLTFKYSDFDLSLVFSGVGKYTRRQDSFQVRPFEENFGNAPSVLIGNYWSALNTPEQNLQARYPRLSAKAEVNNYAVSDFWLFNGGYFRMKNITLGYTIPASILSRVKLRQLRFYVGMRDYFTIGKNFLPGWDPEATSTGYPIMKSLLFGVNVKF